MRCGFFYLASKEWTLSAGVAKATSGASLVMFCTLDQAATLFQFLLCVAAASFYIEHYYFAIDASQRYSAVIRPLQSALVVSVVAVQALLSMLLAWTIRQGRSLVYAPISCAIFYATLYAGGGVAFQWFALFEVPKVLREVPTELMIRRRLLTEVRVLGVLAWAMVLRAVALVLIAGRRLYLGEPFSMALGASYFILLDFIPVLIVLYFFRRMPISTDEVLGGNSRIEEKTALISNNKRGAMLGGAAVG